jgi:hypothetical protein
LRLRHQDVTTIDVPRDALERREHRLLLICHADGLVVANVEDAGIRWLG